MLSEKNKSKLVTLATENPGITAEAMAHKLGVAHPDDRANDAIFALSSLGVPAELLFVHDFLVGEMPEFGAKFFAAIPTETDLSEVAPRLVYALTEESEEVEGEEYAILAEEHDNPQEVADVLLGLLADSAE